jgi:CheY-like chemotaxis protein
MPSQTNQLIQNDKTMTTTIQLRTILIIDDEGDMCLLIKGLLKADDINIVCVQNLFDAQSFIKNVQPDLILLDNRLPDGFGVDFIDHIKTNHPAIKIIMITGIDPAAQDFALEAGADTFLSKPFTRKELQRSVDQLLN